MESETSNPWGVPKALLEHPVSVQELADWLRVDHKLVRRVMAAPDAPPPLRTGRKLLWNPRDAFQYLHSASTYAPAPGAVRRSVPGDAPASPPSGPVLSARAHVSVTAEMARHHRAQRPQGVAPWLTRR